MDNQLVRERIHNLHVSNDSDLLDSDLFQDLDPLEAKFCLLLQAIAWLSLWNDGPLSASLSVKGRLLGHKNHYRRFVDSTRRVSDLAFH
jgi:hypothetical protein